jgi:hypothetical protein
VLHSVALCSVLSQYTAGKKMLSVKEIDNIIDISSNAEWLGKLIGFVEPVAKGSHVNIALQDILAIYILEMPLYFDLLNM